MRERDDLVFPMVEYHRRLNDLRRRMAQQDVDLLLTTTPENMTYLSGFETLGYFRFNALLIPLENDPVGFPRQLEDSGMEALTWIETRTPYQDHDDPMEKLAQLLHQMPETRIGYEKESWFFTAAQQEQLMALCPKKTFIDCSGMVEEGRVIKSEAELVWMRQAARASETGMRAGIDAIQAGATENDVAAAMYYALIKAGSEWPAIAPFVASGYRGAIGHATWAGRTLQPNEIVMLELSGALKRYHAPLMRSIFLGTPPPEIREAERRVLEAFDATVDAIKPGVPAGDVDAVARAILSGGAGSTQASRTAYSVGIALSPDWGEGHIISMQQGETRLLRENMTFHLLPWIQVPGKGGLSISETIRVTADGCEFLTSFERGLIVR